MLFHYQVCEQCPNVKYEREGYFVTVDIEKGMQDGQVSFYIFQFVFYLLLTLMWFHNDTLDLSCMLLETV